MAGNEPTFQVRARGLDAQESRQWSEVFADELTAEDLAAMGPAERQEAEAWRAAIERANQCTGLVTLHNAEASPETMTECGAAAE